MTLEHIQHVKDIFEHWVILHPTASLAFIFGLVLFESLAVIGMLLPGTILMTVCGALIGAGLIPFIPAIVLAMSGAIIGDGLSYSLGFYYKEQLRDVWLFRRYPHWISNCEAFFDKHGGKSVFLGRIGPLRALIPIVAGMLHMKPRAFFIANIPASMIWAPAYMLPGILLGIASLQFPPSVTTKFLSYLFIALIILWLGGWLIKRILQAFFAKLDRGLDWIWQYCQSHPVWRPLCLALQDPYYPDRHRQLTSACLVLLGTILLSGLAYAVYTQTGLTHINRGIHFFCRTLHTHIGMQIAIVISSFGDKLILLPLMIPVAVYLTMKRQFYSAIHWIMIGVLSAGSIYVIKLLVHSPRPPGLSGSLTFDSFPSGHTTLSIALWGFLAVIIARSSRESYRWISYTVAITIASLVALSRLYLGAHWFTDVIGGVLSGSTLLLLVTISYRRLKTRHVQCFSFVSIVLLCFLAIMLTHLMMTFSKQEKKYTPYWPDITLNQQRWWDHHLNQIPLFRPNRFGHAMQLFNVQWLGNINLLRTQLASQDWETIEDASLQSILKRLAAKPAERALPVMPVSYLNHHAVLTMIKKVGHGNHQIMLVLQLWTVNIHFQGNRAPLRLGTVRYFVPKKTDSAAMLTLPPAIEALQSDLGPLPAKVRTIEHAHPDKVASDGDKTLQYQTNYDVLLISATDPAHLTLPTSAKTRWNTLSRYVGKAERSIQHWFHLPVG